MAKAGVRCFVDSGDMAVVGLTEVFGKLKTIIRASNILKSVLEKHRPDLLILIDYPGFNLRMARIARRYKVPVLYYISPQVWAWRQGRVKKIAKRVDRMAVILPFEKPFLQKNGIRVDYVGHPLMDAFEKNAGPGETQIPHGTSPSDIRGPLVAMVPGSRREEISNLLPVMLQAGEILQSEYPGIRFVLPLAETISPEFLDGFMANTGLPVSVRKEGIYEALANCDLAFVTSGTATLDAAIMGVPMLIVYKAKRLTYQIGKRVIKVPYLGLVNLVSQECIAPELIQEEATPENLVKAARRFLNDESLRQETIKKLGIVKATLGRGGASKRTAQIAAEMLNCS